MYNLYSVLVTTLLSCGTFCFTVKLIPKFKEMFLKANLYGVDLNKTNSSKVPEAQGVIIGCVYLIVMCLSIVVPFSDSFFGNEDFPHKQLVEMLSALLSICCMLLLGFADDVLDLRWRHKLLLPTIASLPLLIVYFVTFNATTVIVPRPFQPFLGFSIDLGVLYYVYMGMLAVFCTNAINILAGVNGLESGQSLILAIGLSIFNIVEAYFSKNLQLAQPHFFALHFLLPYIAVTAALFKYNWYPAEAFVGDTFCYFSGMTFAVVGILGHFSKTMMLFFIPQIFNFLYSVPQLFHIVPCPRHRLPRLNKETGLLENSFTPLDTKNETPTLLNKIMMKCLQILHRIRLVNLKSDSVSNLTLINLLIVWKGPMHEKELSSWLLLIQVLSCFIAFIVRYPLAHLFYDNS